jgi:hypothetical protein
MVVTDKQEYLKEGGEESRVYLEYKADLVNISSYFNG